MRKREKAAIYNEKARKLEKRGKLKEAIEQYRKAALIDPSWSAPPYNLGLLFKYQCKWKEALEYNRRAVHADPNNKEAWWNFGIAATALGRWNLACQGWRGFGIDIPDGDGPIDLPCGFSPIRINPKEEAEVVWAHRIDPARAVLASIPFPESNHRWKDIVLNDGAPMGFRTVNGKKVPVLDELQLLEPSAFGTFVATVHVGDNPQATARLAQIAEQMEGCAEDWSTSIRIFCKKCSEGSPHDTHDTEAAPPAGAHILGIAATDRKHAAKILHTWKLEVGGVEVESLDDELGPATAE
jgi:tetratricopeptide (TPR) repeat protein